MPLYICRQLVKKTSTGWFPGEYVFSIRGWTASCPAFAGCLLTLIDDSGYLKGNVFSVCKALDPGCLSHGCRGNSPSDVLQNSCSCQAGQEASIPREQLEQASA